MAFAMAEVIPNVPARTASLQGAPALYLDYCLLQLLLLIGADHDMLLWVHYGFRGVTEGFLDSLSLSFVQTPRTKKYKILPKIDS